MDIFLKEVTPPQEDAQAGPSEGILEKGIVIINDRYMCVIAPARPCSGTRCVGGRW